MTKKNFLLLITLLVAVFPICSQEALKNFPADASPVKVGQLLSNRFLSMPHAPDAYDKDPHIPYFEVCNWYGALTFAKASKDTALASRLVERFQPLFTTDARMLPVPDHVDYTMFGALPLEIYMQTKNANYLSLGKLYADTQWKAPVGPRVVPASYDWYNKGYTWQTRLWIDDMYMITIVQSQAYRATGDTQYINRTAREMILYLDSLQKPNGLFYHAPASPFYWGRGNGWMAAGMAELLRSLPRSSPYRPRIMNGYTTMMSSLLHYQAEDGMWRQLIDDTAAWKETSSTAMFAFAMITGVKNGWLPAKPYAAAARKAWLSLITYINDDGAITNVCEGTGAGNNRQYYLDRKKITGDMHGQSPVLWCATALLRK